MAQGDEEPERNLDDPDQTRSATLAQQWTDPEQHRTVRHERRHTRGLLRRELIEAEHHEKKYQTPSQNAGADASDADLHSFSHCKISMCVLHAHTFRIKRELSIAGNDLMTKLRTANLLGALAGEIAGRLERHGRIHPNETSSAAAALNVIGFYEGCSNSALSRALGLSHPATVRLVDKLEAAGLEIG